jgi:hypothetical protein
VISFTSGLEIGWRCRNCTPFRAHQRVMNDRASYHRLSFQVAAGGVSNILRQPTTEAGQVWPTRGEVFLALGKAPPN